jgi:CheY-like chemotaxis protein
MSVAQPAALILYVEDEVLIQEYLQTALEEAGFEVLVVSSGLEAVDQLQSRSRDLRGMITDVNLGPGMKGWEVGRHARSLAPDLPIIYVSGGSEQDWGHEGVALSVMIPKPFASAEVVTAISRMIATASALRP